MTEDLLDGARLDLSPLIEYLFYSDPMPHHQDPDRLITAHLHGAATRHAGWRTPVGPAREAALAELREIATITASARRGSPHRAEAVLRADLLAEVAGILLGAAKVDSRPGQKRIAADLLIDAGADVALIEEWVAVGRARMQGGGPAFSASESALPPGSALRQSHPS